MRWPLEYELKALRRWCWLVLSLPLPTSPRPCWPIGELTPQRIMPSWQAASATPRACPCTCATDAASACRRFCKAEISADHGEAARDTSTPPGERACLVSRMRDEQGCSPGRDLTACACVADTPCSAGTWQGYDADTSRSTASCSPAPTSSAPPSSAVSSSAPLSPASPSLASPSLAFPRHHPQQHRAWAERT